MLHASQERGDFLGEFGLFVQSSQMHGAFGGDMEEHFVD